MHCDLKDTDILTRFVYKSDEIHWEAEKPRTNLFSKKHPDGYSVFETTNLSDEEVESIEKKYARGERDQAYARCDLATQFYRSAGLTIVKDEPPPRHYNIFGMPISNDLKDADNLNFRQRMAAESRLKVYRQKVS